LLAVGADCAASRRAGAAGELCGSENDYCGIYCGVLFKLVLANGTWTEKVLHNFDGPKADGQFPQSPLIVSPDGSLYGTTGGGGRHSGGTAFEWKR